MLVDDAIERELDDLADKLQDGPGLRPPASLNGRMATVRRNKARETVAEIMYLILCNKFRRLGAPLVSSMKESGYAAPNEVPMAALSTDIHSQDKLALVYKVLGKKMMSTTGEPFDFKLSPASAMPVVSVGQLYVIAMLFGHLLRKVDSKYQLEKSFGMAASGLAQYVDKFDPGELEDMGRFGSLEAQLAAELHVRGVFGNLAEHREELMRIVAQGDPLESKEDTQERLRRALSGTMLRFQSGELRRLLLEAVAFGGFLGDVNSQVGAVCDLTPTKGWRLSSFGMDDPRGAGGSMFLKWLLEH